MMLRYQNHENAFEICNEILDLNIEVKQVVGEFEMYMGDEDKEFEKLESIIEKFESKGFQTYCNRILAKTNAGHIPNNPCVELAFIRK